MVGDVGGRVRVDGDCSGDRMCDSVAFSARSFYFAPCPPPRRSSRRPQSFHRYARIVPNSPADQMDRKQHGAAHFGANDPALRSRSRYAFRNSVDARESGTGCVQMLNGASHFGIDEFDDLVDGLHATKVTETHLNPHA